MGDFLNSEFESILAEAIERVESGDLIDSVIASYPAHYRNELHNMLFVIDGVQQVGTEPVPMPSPERRSAAKLAFLAAAREEAAEDAAATPAATESHDRHESFGSNTNGRLGGVNRPATGHSTVSSANGHYERSVQQTAGYGLFDRIADWMTEFFGISTMRLAPVAAVLLMAILSISSFYTVAWSVPGDIAYPFKEWTRNVQLDVAPVEDRAELVKSHDENRMAELEEAQERVDQKIEEAAETGEIDRNDAVRAASMRSIYNGRIDGDLLVFGATDVVPRYQEDANVDAWTEIEFADGQSWDDLVEGVEVEVEYQIVPGAEHFVQGTKLRIINPASPVPLEEPTPEPTLEPTQAVTAAQSQSAPTATTISVPASTAQRDCVLVSQPGWRGSYVVRTGDTLSGIAAAYQVSLDELGRANCITNPNRIVPGSKLNVPNQLVNASGGQANPQAQPTAAPTSTPTRDLLPILPTDTVIPPTFTQDNTPIPELTIPPQTQVPTETPAVAETDLPVENPTDEPASTSAATPTVAATTGDAPSTTTAYPAPVQTSVAVTSTATVVIADVTPVVITSTVSPLPTEVVSTTVPTDDSTGDSTDGTGDDDAGNSDADSDETNSDEAGGDQGSETGGDQGAENSADPTPVVTPTLTSTGNISDTTSSEDTILPSPEPEPTEDSSLSQPTATDGPVESETSDDASPDSDSGNVDAGGVQPESTDSVSDAENETDVDVDDNETEGDVEGGDVESGDVEGNVGEEVGDGSFDGETSVTPDADAVPTVTISVEPVNPDDSSEPSDGGATQEPATETSDSNGASEGDAENAGQLQPVETSASSAPPTDTSVPTQAPPTQASPTSVPTQAPPTPVPPTPVPTQVPPTPVPPTPVPIQEPPTQAPPTPVPPTPVPPTPVPPTPVPPTPVPPTPVPTQVPPTPVPPADDSP